MQKHNVQQGSNEWFELRAGIPTASDFHKIVTPTGKLSKQSDALANLLVAERLVGHRVSDFKGNSYTERGNELEAQAVSAYEFLSGNQTEEAGFWVSDGCGASPDRLVGEDGLLEIKCPAAHNHVALMLSGKIDQEHYPQIQGQLMVTGRQWVDIVSYHPELEPIVCRVIRDEEYIATLRQAIIELNETIESRLAALSKS
jgi:hypothetical protein